MSTLAPEAPASTPKSAPQWGLIVSVVALAITLLGSALTNYSQWVLLKDSDARQEKRIGDLETRQGDLKDNVNEKLANMVADVREIKAILREQQKLSK